MTKLLRKIISINISVRVFNCWMLLFRIAIAGQLMVVHRFRKIGWGVAVAEEVPNPLHLPHLLNQSFAIAANLIFPLLILMGLLTRLAILPVLAVTLTGYFIEHWGDTLLERDPPFMYSIAFLLLLVLGPGRYSLDRVIERKLY